MKKLRVFQIAILLVSLLTTISLWSSEFQMMNTQTPLEYNTLEQGDDFHEDFDSTYVWNGCMTKTFKLNHKCKE